MIWNTIPNEERLRLWKKLRDDLKELTLDEQLMGVAKFCSSIPYGSRTIDYYSPENWPTPWEVLFYGSFCTSSISLLIYYTLDLTVTDTVLELILVESEEGIYLLPIVNNKNVLNHELGQVSTYSDIKDDFTELKRYSQAVIKRIS